MTVERRYCAKRAAVEMAAVGKKREIGEGEAFPHGSFIPATLHTG